jgi:hypothetical protein
MGITTPNFELQGNTATLINEISDGRGLFCQQLLLNIMVRKTFIFTVRVRRTKRKGIVVGVVDKLKQKDERSSHKSAHAVCYNGLGGKILYGEDGKCKEKCIREEVCEGM